MSSCSLGQCVACGTFHLAFPIDSIRFIEELTFYRRARCWSHYGRVHLLEGEVEELSNM